MTWIKIDRDEDGFATEECLDKMRKSVPFIAVTRIQHRFVNCLINDERDFIIYKETIYSGGDVTHYLPIPKLEV